MNREVSLQGLQDGTEAVIKSLPAGEAGRRLEALGIRPGKTIVKVSGMPFGGPVTLLLDHRQFAIGSGIASKIRVEPLGPYNEGELFE